MVNKPAATDVVHVQIRGEILFAALQLALLTGLQASLSRQVRPALAQQVEGTGKQDGRQAAQHDHGQHLGEQLTLLLVQDFRISHGQWDGSLANTAGHYRDHEEKQGVLRSET